MARRVFITVGEASGDQHAGNLIKELRALDPDIIVEGHGGDAMRAAGATVHFDTVHDAAMGWRGALRLLEMKRLLKWTEDYFEKSPPDLQICIDSFAMNWHWARLAHQRGVAVMYYIPPQIWASRPWRIKKLARYVDRIACIHLFEEKYYRDRGVEATFVGHPLFDALQRREPRKPEDRFPKQPPVIGLLPGSRSSVSRENFPNLLEVADRILEVFPAARFMIPTMQSTENVVTRFLAERAVRLGQDPTAHADATHLELQSIGPFTFGKNNFDELVIRCDLCIAVSGTATLHVAGHGIPMIVVYRLNPVIWHLAARWIVNARTFSLVNLLSDSRSDIVPEFVPWYGSNSPVAAKALEYLQNPQMLDEQRTAIEDLMRGLNRPGASKNAANLAVDLMNARAVTPIALPPHAEAEAPK